MMVGFGSWQPDSAGLNTKDQAGRALMAIAKNVYPGRNGYIPIPSLQVLQTGAAISGTVCGAFSARTSAGGWVIFVGTTTKLLKFNSGTSTFDDYTRVSGGAYSVPIGDFWTFCPFGSKVLACNINDNPQVIDIDTGATAFADLAGSPPKARYVGTVGDFVFLACLGSNPRKVRNSAINDTTGWSVGVNLCDEQELPDGDNITGFSGGEFGWVVQQHAIRRVIFQPGFDQAFRFERDERERGAIGPYSVVGVRDTIFFKADDGFYSFGPAGLKPIGHLRVDGFFATNSDTKRYPLGFSDPTGPRVFWVYYSTANATLPDRKLIYDWDQDEWSAEEETAQFWARLVTAGTTLEGLNVYGSIDYPSAGAGPGIPYPLDSPVWQGGVPVVGAITSAGLLAFKSGAPNTATLTTCPLQLVPEGRANVANVFPAGIFNDATVALRIGRREHSAAAVSYTPSLTPSSKSGIARTKASGRLHNVELTLSQSSGTNWEHAIGVDLEANQDGRK